MHKCVNPVQWTSMPNCLENHGKKNWGSYN